MTIKTVQSKTDFDVPEGTPLPPIGVSRALAGTEIARLRRKVAALEREIANGGVNSSGMAVPYLAARAREARDELERVKDEVVDLESMDEHSARVWAYRRA